MGRRMAFYEAISTLISAGISLSEIGLDGFVPENILTGKLLFKNKHDSYIYY